MSKSVKDSSIPIVNMEYSAKKDVQIQDDLICKALRRWQNRRDFLLSKEKSISACILRRQWDPTVKTKYTVLNRANTLKRAVLHKAQDNGLTYSPFWKQYQEVSGILNVLPSYTPLAISDTIG